MDSSASAYAEGGTAESSGAKDARAESGKTKSSAAESGTAKCSPAEGSAAKSDAESGVAKDSAADAGTKSGAGSGTAKTGADTAPSEGLQSGAEENPEQRENGSGGGEEPAPSQIPQLPEAASELAGFVPEGWEILDSVKLDFNEDGIPDYVGVLEAAMIHEGDYWTYQDNPRILFAVAGDGAGGYRLDFQDINLIRTRGEGGIFGDPYEPLTAEGTSFTTHAYGGSAWRWSEDYTYTCRGGTWRLTSSETTYGYGSYTTSYSRNDWDSGRGIRKERSSEFSDMEKNWDKAENQDSGDGWDSLDYDLEYEVPLDEPMTLEQAGKRWWLAKDRVKDWEVASVACAAGVELSEEKVKRPGEAYLEYCDEDCVLYSFFDEESGLSYLAMYRWEDSALSVLTQEKGTIDYPEIYKGKIYYATHIVENVKYRTWQDGKEQTAEEEDTVGVRLNRMSPDGTGKETVFEYRYPEEEQEIRESRIPYLSLVYEISGDEIIAEVYTGDKPHPFYRMKTDGSGAKKIGQVPMASSKGPEELLDAFLAGEIPAYYDDRGDASIKFDQLPIEGEDWNSYSVGERIDLDNDGENELILDGPYGGMYIDARAGKVYVLAEGEGTAGVLSYTVYDNATWIVHSDTTHAGRQIYWLTRYDGNGNIADEFQLGAEYWDSPDDKYDENSDFTYRDAKISMEEYETLLSEIFGLSQVVSIKS